jgi:hypothetical protein
VSRGGEDDAPPPPPPPGPGQLLFAEEEAGVVLRARDTARDALPIAGVWFDDFQVRSLK